VMKRAIVPLLAASIGLASAGCTDSQGNFEPGSTAVAVVTAPLWIPYWSGHFPTSSVSSNVRPQISEATVAAAQRGDDLSQFEVGVAYESKGDFLNAAMWYRKSAENGYDQAQVNLGILYEAGKGVGQDKFEADMLYVVAARSDGPVTITAESAARHRDALEQRMTPEQIAEARKRGQEWKPSTAPASPSNSTTASGEVTP